MGQRGFIAGLKPERYDGKTIRVLTGSCWCVDTGDIYEQTTNVMVPLVGFSNYDEVYVWLVRNSSGTVYPIVGSWRFQGDVPVPSGGAVVRKLPFGAIYNTACGGLPAWHLAHWPLPEVTLTEAEDTAYWQAARSLSTHDHWQEISLTRWVPDNARVALVVCIVGMKGKRAGSAFIRSLGSEANGEKVGSANPSFDTVGGERTIRLTSTRSFYVKTIGSATITIRVKGYHQTEAS